jgi:hypothetical protein
MNYSIEDKLAGITTIIEAMATGNVNAFYIRLAYYNDSDRLEAICLHLTWYLALNKLTN